MIFSVQITISTSPVAAIFLPQSGDHRVLRGAFHDLGESEDRSLTFPSFDEFGFLRSNYPK